MKSEAVILVTGGARSGKSVCAEKIVLAAGPRPFYIATAPVLDEEMSDRVARHRARRQGQGWTTIEEELDLAAALRQAAEAGATGILIDCLTLWINNLLYREPELDEAAFAPRAEALAAVLRELPCQVVCVINEVGLGLVPESALSRRFRDLSGRCAQIVAATADEVYFMVAGISQRIKCTERHK